MPIRLPIAIACAVALLMGSCAPRVAHRTTEPTARSSDVHVRVTRFPGIWVAGFLAASNPEIDISTETVRLLRSRLKTFMPIPVIETPPVGIDGEAQFADAALWRRLGEERGGPLIVTGSVTLLLAPPAIVQRGVRTRYYAKAGRVLKASVILIDGRTGSVLARHDIPTRVRYGTGPSTPALALYFQMMDESWPDWWAAIASS